MDARAFVAGTFDAALDFVSWRISFWRAANQRTDVAIDCYGGERGIWSTPAERASEADDNGIATGNDLRRDWACAPPAGGGSGTSGESLVREFPGAEPFARARRGSQRAASGRVHGTAANRAQRSAAANFGRGERGSERGRSARRRKSAVE